MCSGYGRTMPSERECIFSIIHYSVYDVLIVIRRKSQRVVCSMVHTAPSIVCLNSIEGNLG